MKEVLVSSVFTSSTFIRTKSRDFPSTHNNPCVCVIARTYHRGASKQWVHFINIQDWLLDPCAASCPRWRGCASIVRVLCSVCVCGCVVCVYGFVLIHRPTDLDDADVLPLWECSGVCVCVCVCGYVCVCVCTSMWYMCTCVRVDVCTHSFMYACTCISVSNSNAAGVCMFDFHKAHAHRHNTQTDTPCTQTYKYNAHKCTQIQCTQMQCTQIQCTQIQCTQCNAQTHHAHKRTNTMPLDFKSRFCLSLWIFSQTFEAEWYDFGLRMCMYAEFTSTQNV